MIFVNPWAYYDPKDSVLAPTPYSHSKSHSKDEESEGCLGAICGFILATIIHIILFYSCFTLTKEGGLRWILMIVESIIIYPIMVICFINLLVKFENIIKKIN